MRLFFQVLMIVALLFFDSHQLRTRGQRSPIPGPVKPLSNGYNAGMGPYDIDIQLFHLCEYEGPDITNTTVEVYNTKTENGSKIMYRGSFVQPLTQDQVNQLRVRVTTFRVKDRKEFQMFKYEENFCLSVAGPGKESFAIIREKVGVEGNGCEVPKGFYSFNDWEVKAELPPPVMEYGHYRTIVELIHEQQVFICCEFLAEVKQKM